MNMATAQKENIFNQKLKDIFIGEEINGNSGHINLMKIKSQYFEDKFEELNELIDKKAEQFEDEEGFKEELYDKLFTFMKKYFSESGSVYFSYTPLDEKVYEQVYDNTEDVTLFWKTHMLYYVKTGQVWDELSIPDYELGDSEYTIEFNIDNIDGRLANEKKEIIFKLEDVTEDSISFNVSYTSTGYGMSDSKRDKLRRTLKSDYDIITTNEELRNVFGKFRKQNEVDYFINKNADSFLKEQFDFQLKNYVLDDETMFNERRLNQIKSIKEIGYELIGFVSQFEEELARIWNKPRAVKKLNYVINYNTLINYTSQNFAEDYIENGNHISQKEEWIQMGLINEKDRSRGIQNILNEKSWLPLDTKYFNKRKLENRILKIDNKIDGRLIKSENYQALSTIKRRFKNQIDGIYIDPPFNTESEAEYDYKIKYKDSTWVTLIENRVELAKELMSENSSIMISCDYNGNAEVKKLFDNLFGEENFRNEIITTRGNSKIGLMSQFQGVKSVGVAHENIYWYSKNPETRFSGAYRELKEEREPYWNSFYKVQDRPTMRYEILGVDLEEGQWMWSKERAMKAVQNYKNFCDSEYEDIRKYWEDNDRELDFVKKDQNGKIKYWVTPKTKEMLETDWTDIPCYSSYTQFKTEKSEKLLKRVIRLQSNQEDTILDFFGGSGTTSSVAHKMNRNWLLVELSNQFYEVILPRMKRVISGKSHGVSNNSKNGFFKYYELEQYEDILQNMSYKESESTLSNYSESWDEYLFMEDEKLAGPTISKEDGGEVKVNLEELYENIDIPETISLLVGQPIREITEEKVVLEDGTANGNRVDLDNPDIEVVKPLLWWGDDV